MQHCTALPARAQSLSNEEEQEQAAPRPPEPLPAPPAPPAPPAVIGVTASFGIAAFPESEAADAEDLVRRADRAVYRAKKMGKNRVELYWADHDQSGAVRSVS